MASLKAPPHMQEGIPTGIVIGTLSTQEKPVVVGRAVPVKFSQLLHLSTPSYSAYSVSLLWVQEKFTLGECRGSRPKANGVSVCLHLCVCL